MYKLSAFEIHSRFIKGELSAKEIAHYFLKRISHFDNKTKAFLHICEERVLEKAQELDKKRAEKKYLGKCAAVPIAIKDNMHIEGEITTCASQFLKNYKAPFSSTVVSLLEEEGALLLGKTNLDEFSMGSSNENSSFFPTKNPWDLSCTPGGSSGGSAAAVAARLCPIATGSDTGGSIRQPASFCGITGFKPTYGRVSRYGLIAFGSSFDQIGPLTTSAKDAAMIMEVIGKPCEKDATSLPLPQENYLEHLSTSLKGKTIGVPWDFLKNMSEKSFDNFSESVKTLESLGAKILPVNLDILKYSLSIYYILVTAEAATNLARFDGIRYGVRSKKATSLDEVYDFSREEGFGPEVKKRIILGTYVLSSGYHDAYYKKAQKVRTLTIRAFEESFSSCDLIAIPTAPNTAFSLGSLIDPISIYLQDIFTIAVNLAGLPAISTPSGFDHDHKPFGLQLIGPQMSDVSVIQGAYAFEQAVKHHEKIPSLFDKEGE